MNNNPKRDLLLSKVSMGEFVNEKKTPNNTSSLSYDELLRRHNELINLYEELQNMTYSLLTENNIHPKNTDKIIFQIAGRTFSATLD